MDDDLEYNDDSDDYDDDDDDNDDDDNQQIDGSFNKPTHPHRLEQQAVSFSGSCHRLTGRDHHYLDDIDFHFHLTGTVRGCRGGLEGFLGRGKSLRACITSQETRRRTC